MQTLESLNISLKVAVAIEKTNESFARLEARLAERGRQVFAGNALTWADMQLLFYVDFVNR